jgi:hypothetical protein
MRLFLVERSEQRPEGKSDGKRQHHVRNQDAREKK